MKLVTYVPAGARASGGGTRGRPRGRTRVRSGGAGYVGGAQWGRAARYERRGRPADDDAGVVAVGPDGMAGVRAALAAADKGRPEDVTLEPGEPVIAHEMRDIELRTPVPDPPTLRDFYVFEQHVKAARARRGAEMIPEWYEFPVFYFSNTVGTLRRGGAGALSRRAARRWTSS